MSRVKRKLSLVLVLTLNGGCRAHLLDSVTIHHTIRELFHIAQAHTTQRRSSLQQSLTVLGGEQSVDAHVRVPAKSAGNGIHEHTLTIGAAAKQDRHRGTIIVGLVAGQ